MTRRTPLVKVGETNGALPAGDHVRGDIGLVTLKNGANLRTHVRHQWSFNETTGDRVDSVGSTDLEPHGDVTDVTGLIGNAARIGTDWWLDWLEGANVSTMELTDDWQACLWYKPLQGVVQHTAILVAGTSFKQADDYPCDFWLVNMRGVPYFFIVSENDDPTLRTFWAYPANTMTYNAWSFICIRYNATDNSMGIRLNDGDWANVDLGDFTPLQRGLDFQFGTAGEGHISSDPQYLVDIDMCNVWKGSLLANSQVDYMYNNGEGRLLPYVQSLQPLTKGMAVYSPLAGVAMKASAGRGVGEGQVIGLVADTTIADGAEGLIQTEGVLQATWGEWNAITGFSSGLTVGAQYFLGGGGGLTTAPPMVATLYVVPVGTAISTTELKINIKQPILL